MTKVDDKFYDRADQHINLSNEQLKSTDQGKVSASMLFSVARFNAWISATGCKDQEHMRHAKQEMIDYFVTEYKKMLDENLDDYIENFNEYMKVDSK